MTNNSYEYCNIRHFQYKNIRKHYKEHKIGYEWLYVYICRYVFQCIKLGKRYNNKN
jgi:hypothetical protein